MPSTKNMAAAFLLTGMALAEPLATLEVCPAAGEKAPTCTVTAQHQPVSTCVPTTTACVADKGCSTGYAMSTYAYVNTVIPCAWDGKSMSSCHVTKTDQPVPCSMSASTMTTSVPYVKTVSKHGHSKVLTSYSTSYETMSKQWVAPYNKLGGMAIPGYEGCDLCEECGEQEDGSKMQHFEVTECSSGDGKEEKCEKYMENRVHMKAAPASTTPCTATNSIKTHVPSAGTYVFTFTNTAPPATITQDSHVYTIPGKPWFNYETRSCNGPEDFDFTVTVTKTVVMNAYETKTGASKAQVDPTEVANWGAWNGPANAPAQVTGHAGGHQNGQKEHAGSSEYFLIPINSGSGSKYSKNGNQYVGFPSGGDDAGMVGKEHAAYFYWDMEGNLMCEGHYISTNTNSGYLVFEKTQEKPSGGYKFTVSYDGSFGMGGGAGFCATESTFFITFSGAPSGCKPVSAHVGGGYGQPDKIWQQWSHTTMMTSMTSSWSAWKTTTSTADPSGDMDWYSWPQETAAPRKRGGMLRKRMN